MHKYAYNKWQILLLRLELKTQIEVVDMPHPELSTQKQTNLKV